ncbi:M20/M25/M40 family metallo-hydrolase, partial [Microbacterium sp. H6]
MRVQADADLDLVLADIETLVSCESPSGDLEAVSRSADVVAALGERLLGVAPERIVIDGRTHLRWRFGDPVVLLLGHHDTVWPLGSLRRLPFTVEDGVLRGPGCFDMKTGVVMALHAVAALSDRTGISILITGDEELGSPSSRALIEQEAIGCAATLVLEASADGGAVKIARKGVSLYRVRVTGRAAHAGLEPERGVNAAVEAAHLVLAIARLGDRSVGTSVTP